MKDRPRWGSCLIIWYDEIRLDDDTALHTTGVLNGILSLYCFQSVTGILSQALNVLTSPLSLSLDLAWLTRSEAVCSPASAYKNISS